ncbi:SDR family NAD(P)-dependent oxidoreductase, partial [Acinetobacter baumannii]
MSASSEKRVAIVTGGASGIGLATASILLEQGWSVVGTDRDAAAL